MADGEEQLPQFLVRKIAQTRTAVFEFAQYASDCRRIRQRIGLSRSSIHVTNAFDLSDFAAFHAVIFAAAKRNGIKRLNWISQILGGVEQILCFTSIKFNNNLIMIPLRE